MLSCKCHVSKQDLKRHVGKTWAKHLEQRSGRCIGQGGSVIAPSDDPVQSMRAMLVSKVHTLPAQAATRGVSIIQRPLRRSGVNSCKTARAGM